MKKRKPRLRTPERKKRNRRKVHPICEMACNTLGLLVFYSIIELLFFRDNLQNKILETFLMLLTSVIVFKFLNNTSKLFRENDEDFKKKYLSNKAIEFVTSWYLYKIIKNQNS